ACEGSRRRRRLGQRPGNDSLARTDRDCRGCGRSPDEPARIWLPLCDASPFARPGLGRVWGRCPARDDRRAGGCRSAARPASGRAYAHAEPFGAMIQELVPGEDDQLYSLGSYLREDGEPLGLFSGRKLVQPPPGIGTCRIGEAVWVQEVVDAKLRLLRGLGFQG